jgi:phenylpropionate dioxygenase-like ring-hydroxylating dioxygenase large terminal subunit
MRDPVLMHEWYPVAKSEDLSAGVKAIRLLEQDLVLWRSPQGIVAWRDRCPHRGAKLSLGRISPENYFICPDLGLAYNSKGHRVDTSPHPDITPSQQLKIEAFFAQERYGLIWVALQKSDRELPIFSQWNNADYRTVLCGAYRYRASAFRALENFLDVAHFPYVHEKLLGDRAYPQIEPYSVYWHDNGIETSDISIWQPDPDGTGQAKQVKYRYQVHRPLVASFTKEIDTSRFAMFLALTPVSEFECLGWMGIAMNYAKELSEDQIKAFQNRLVQQDIAIVESQNPQQLPLNSSEFHLPADKLSVVYRQWLKQLGITFGVA